MEKGLWHLPGERSKNKLPIARPLCSEAVKVIEEALEWAGKDTQYIFPSVRGKGPVLVTSVNRAMSDIFEGKEDRPRLHDLRRTTATRLSELGVQRLIVDKILHHKDRSVGAIYDRSSHEAEMRRALLQWERKLRSIVEGKKEEKAVEGKKEDAPSEEKK